MNKDKIISLKKKKNKDKTASPSLFQVIRSALSELFGSLFASKKTHKSTQHDSNQNPQNNIINVNFETFYSKKVEDVFIPRSNISSIKKDATIEEISWLINDSGHTRILVQDGDLDNIIGFFHIKDLFKLISENKKFLIKDYVRSHLVTTPSTKLINLLALMRKKQVHIAIVVDEYGGTDGMVTIEDIIEEITGPINDEHDEDDGLYKINPDDSVIMSARMQIEEVENLTGIKIRNDEDDDCDTIGGLIMSKIGHLPKVGEKIIISSDIKFEVMQATKRSIIQLKMTLVGEHKIKNRDE